MKALLVTWAGLVLILAAAACADEGPSARTTRSPLVTPVTPPSPTAAPLFTLTGPSSPTPASPPLLAITPTMSLSPVPSALPLPTPTLVPLAPPSPTAAPTQEPEAGVEVVPSPLAEMAVERMFPRLSFDRMVHLTHPGDGTGRLFLVLQPGRVMVFDNDQGVGSTETFMDIRNRVSDRGNEEGLLGLAFDPEYASNGYFYAYYSAANPRRSVISRFSVSAENPDRADPSSERIIMEVPQPYSNHNGGQVLFGPDGYLYIGLGDGGLAGDPHGNGQDTSTLLGSILRIDVASLDLDGTYAVPPDNPFVGQGGSARGEVWAYGLRNPWRFTFDRQTGDLWAADVGQDRSEEVDIIKPGRNYGWNIMEGLHCYPLPGCNQQGLELPITEYGREGGCSVTGGYVYRGSRLPSLYGAYVYGDFCSGKIWALRHDGAEVTEELLIVDSPLSISAFGEDLAGELYILSFDGGIYRIKEK